MVRDGGLAARCLKSLETSMQGILMGPGRCPQLYRFILLIDFSAVIVQASAFSRLYLGVFSRDALVRQKQRDDCAAAQRLTASVSV